MEDRTSAGLYLEMIDKDLGGYLDHRLAEVLALPGQRATWWNNAHQDRSDLPRVLAEFSYLAVYEVGATFITPHEFPAGVAGHHFVRTPRPGQGILSGKPTIGLSLVLISPKDEQQSQPLRDWADFVHIRHIAEVAVPGYAMITPYINADALAHPRFMHFYEMDCEDPERAFKAMTPLVTQQIGPTDSSSWKHWAHHPALRIMYVNTFTRVGERRSFDQ